MREKIEQIKDNFITYGLYIVFVVGMYYFVTTTQIPEWAIRVTLINI